MSEYIGLSYFLDSHQRVYWLYLLVAIMIALAHLFVAPNLVKKQFSKEVLWHKSARLDYLNFLIAAVVKIVFILPIMIGVGEVALWGVLTLQELFGYFERIHISKEFLLILYTFAVFIVNDFTRYWMHRVMHKVPFLWRFHRIHHSAEALTPLTFYRVHPVENLLFGFRYALSIGIITAIFIYFFGAGISMGKIWGVNIFVFIFSLLGSNLRHSHIPLSYGEKMQKIFISPYQHQLHHSTEFTHKNFGAYLAIWDLWFGSLENKKHTNLVYGLKGEKVSHSFLGLFLNPFVKRIKL